MRCRFKLLSIVFSFAITGAIGGCTDMKPPIDLPQTRVQTDNVLSERSGLKDAAQSHFVTCRATLTAFNEKFVWFENSDAGHDGGVSPLATFQITEPSSSLDHVVSILFKYGADYDIPAPPAEEDLGRQFSFEIPTIAVTQNVSSVDNATVKNFRKLQP